ncbi:MAG: hypothetical protein Ct9H90mP7_2540 [Candidatus Neomarinimicrobiota bacterium]|nr:MAG: hypothetical protein Ct9H90mP7_2540 [Candidatus Neomarinimicrobiota bacterium]
MVNIALLEATGAIDNVTIGDRAIFACYPAVTKDFPRGEKMYSGAPLENQKKE